MSPPCFLFFRGRISKLSRQRQRRRGLRAHSFYALRTTRNPMLLEALSGVFELRAATR